MTIIAARGRAIACDTLGSNGSYHAGRGTKVVSLSCGCLAGISGDYDAERFLRRGNHKACDRESVEDLWDKYRAWVKERDRLTNGETPAAIIFVTPAGVFQADRCGNVLIAPIRGAVDGSGYQFADGALSTIAAVATGLSDEEACRLAVSAAITGNPHCGGEIEVYSLPKGGA